MANIVKVKLGQKSFVHGGPRNAGEIVELPETAPNLETGEDEPFAELFGKIVSDETPVSPDPVSGQTFGGLHDKDPAEDEE